LVHFWVGDKKSLLKLLLDEENTTLLLNRASAIAVSHSESKHQNLLNIIDPFLVLLKNNFVVFFQSSAGVSFNGFV
jgi:hypothetical protein